MKLNQYIFLILLLKITNVDAQNTTFITKNTFIKSSFRAIYAQHNTQTIWASGSNGYILKLTLNDTNTTAIKPKDSTDFRDIHCTNRRTVVAMSSGSPAYIFRSHNNGKTFQNVYENTDKNIFLDGMDFFNAKHGICFGDPINQKFVLIATQNGGKTWLPLDTSRCPNAKTNEAAFAASGTSIRTANKKTIYIATGGNVSRLLFTQNFGKKWHYYDTPFTHETASKGIYSLVLMSQYSGILVGGDYTNDTSKTDNCYLFKINPKTKQITFSKPEISPHGYRSCIEAMDKKNLIACGTSGVDVSTDGGKSWTNISPQSFNTIAVNKKTKTAILAGNKGKIGFFKLK